EARGCVFDPYDKRRCGKPQHGVPGPLEVGAVAIHRDGLDVDIGNDGVLRGLPRGERYDPLVCREPQAAVTAFHSGGPGAERRGRARHAVEVIEEPERHRMFGFRGNLPRLTGKYEHGAFARVEPDFAPGVFDDVVDASERTCARTADLMERSEERRVGEESRGRGGPEK